MKTHPMKQGTYTVSSGYGPRWGTFHAGLDFAAPIGTPIYAAEDGYVVEGKDRTGVSGFGSWIWIDAQAACGKDFIYGHVKHSGILVRKGDRVKAGQQIGVVGNEGETTGPHLHFETWGPPGRIGGSHSDPAVWLQGAAQPGAAAPTPPKENPVSYFDVDWSPRFNFGGPRPTAGIQRVVVHTTENTAGTPAENVANYQITLQSGSYHVLVDTTGKRLRENTDDWITWSVGNNAGNVQGLNISFVAQAAWSRAAWLAQDRMLRQGATVVAHWCKTYNIPVKKVTTERGICGHGDLRVFGGTDHTDPGGNFPWDVFIRYVNEAISGTNQPKEWSDMASKEEIRQVVREEIAAFCGPIGHDTKRLAIQFGLDADDDGFGRVPGWVQGGHRALYDLVSAIAEKAGVPRTKDTLPEAPKNARNPKLKG